MTLAEQLTELKKKFAIGDELNPTILLRVLDSMFAELEAQRARSAELGKSLAQALETLAEKVPYRNPEGH